MTTTFHPSLSAANLKALIGIRVYFLMTVATNVISLSTHPISCTFFELLLTAHTVMIMKPLLGSRSAMGEYRPKGSQLRTVRWRVMESILQSAAIFLVSSIVYTVMTFVSPLGFGFWHYISHPIVVRMSSGPLAVEVTERISPAATLCTGDSLHAHSRAHLPHSSRIPPVCTGRTSYQPRRLSIPTRRTALPHALALALVPVASSDRAWY